MRALTSTLASAQVNLDKPPLWKVVLSRTSQTTRGYDNSRILRISRSEEPDSFKATITLNNYDGALTSLDFEHYQAVISKGYATGISRSAWVANTAYALDDIIVPNTANGYQYRCSIAGTSHASIEPTWPTDLGVTVTDGTVTWEMDGNVGDEYSRIAPLRVRVQELRSGIGQLLCILRCIGQTDQMKEDKAIATYTQLSTDTNTVKTLISALAAAGTGLSSAYNGYTAITVVYDSEDSLIDSFIPADYFSISMNETRWDKLKELLDYTGCKKRFENDGKLHIFVPEIDGLYEYYNAGDDSSFYGHLTRWLSQTFTPSSAHYITSVKLKLLRIGLPGTITAGIRATDGAGQPTGSDLATGTTDGDTLTTDTAGEWREITLTSALLLSANIKYAIVIRPSATDTTNRIVSRYDNTSPTYSNGLFQYSLDSGATWTDTGADVMFEEYGNNYEYKFNVQGNHNFWNKSVRFRFIQPNKEIVKTPTSFATQYTGNATSAVSYALDPKTHTTEGRFVSDAQCTAIATAIIERSELDDEKGLVLVPPNVGQELWDYVKVTDSRQNDTRAGNVQYIQDDVEIFPGTNKRPLWTMVLAFGKVDILTLMASGVGGVAGVGGVDRLSQLESLVNILIENMKANWERTFWVEEDIPDNLDDIADGTSYQRLLATQTAAGKIYLSDTSTFMASYDPSNKRRVFVATPTTPYDVGDLWLDSSVIKRCTTARASGTYVAADWTAQTVDSIAQGTTNQFVLATELSAGRISLTATNYYSGKFSGEWYSMGAASGVDLDATSGINIYGKANALVTRATKTGTIQCYVGSDGKLYAGAGAVWLDSTGITIDGQVLYLNYGGTVEGYVYGTSNGLAIAAASGKNLSIGIGGTFTGSGIGFVGSPQPAAAATYDLGSAGLDWLNAYIDTILAGTILPRTGTIVSFGTNQGTTPDNFLPTYNDIHCIGSSTLYWWKLYADHIYYKDHQAFQDHDDLAIIKAMKARHITDREGKTKNIVDPETIHPDLKEEGGLISLGAMQGLALGAIKQLADRLEILEKRT